MIVLAALARRAKLYLCMVLIAFETSTGTDVDCRQYSTTPALLNEHVQDVTASVD